MVEAGPAVQRLSRALRALWEAADVSYKTLGRKTSPVRIPSSTLSDWLKGTSAPSVDRTEQFIALTGYLQGTATDKGRRHAGPTGREWRQLLHDAQRERAQNRGGRPKTAARASSDLPTSGTASAAVQVERDRVFRVHDALVDATFRSGPLVAREKELGDLQRFCTSAQDDSRSAYLWWQAGPWAGKTALLAEFVMRHRPPGVEVVSCFITDRLGNNTREEFLAEIGPQLAVIAGRMPLKPRVRPNTLPELYDAAAHACGQQGQRLLLVVDGLDEDALDEGRSIAALLPKNPPAGMLVVVAGRPNPPLPDDVPVDHPLRTPGVVRELQPYPDAKIISAMAERDLNKLLQQQTGSDLLAVITVARGGLTGRDLAEVTGVRPYDIDMRLHRITGRGLLPEKSGYSAAPDAEERRYILGHDELYRTARTKLGETELERAEQRLHGWARTYQEKGWPAHTPDYLLYSYPVLLTHAGEQNRLLHLALDFRRQVALLRSSSADAALSHLEMASRGILHSGAADLGTLAALAASRHTLMEGARALPPSLPQALARLGHAERAIQVARATAFPADRARRLAAVAGVLAETGHPYALRVAREAATSAEQARADAEGEDVYDAEVAAAEAAIALVQTAQDREGLDLLATVDPPASSGDETLLCVMLTKASLAIRPRSAELAEELLDQAERAADQIGEPVNPAAPITAWAAIDSAAGPARAAGAFARLLEYVDTFPPGLTGAYVRATAASEFAADRPEQATELARQAAQHLNAVLTAPEPPTAKRTDRWDLETALTASVRALVDIGDVDQAGSLIASIPSRLHRTLRGGDIRTTLLALLEAPRPAEEAAQQAAALALQGQSEEAERRLAEAFGTAPLHVAVPREEHLEFLARALAITGQFADAELLAQSMADPPRRVRALAAVALHAATTGRPRDASRLAHQAAEQSRDLPGIGNFSLWAGSPGSRAAAAQAIAAQALAHAGDRDAALALAEEITQVNDSAGSQAFLAVAAGLRSYDPATAVRLVDRERERLTADPKKANAHVYELVGLLTAVADCDPPCTARIEHDIEGLCEASGMRELDPEDQLVISVLEARNQREDALALLALAKQQADFRPPGNMEPAAFAMGHAAFGKYDEARHAALDNASPRGKAIALAAVADYLSGNEPSYPSTSQSAEESLGQILRSLALLVAPPDTDAVPCAAEGFVREALADNGWYHALPALARIAPDAVERVRDIVFAHRQLPGPVRPAGVSS